jgi:uracil-DNA glycosylase
MGKARCTIVECGFNCKKDNANSHKHLKWNFTDAVIEQIETKKKVCCFMLWGAFAQKKGNKIDRNKHLV